MVSFSFNCYNLQFARLWLMPKSTFEYKDWYTVCVYTMLQGSFKSGHQRVFFSRTLSFLTDSTPSAQLWLFSVNSANSLLNSGCLSHENCFSFAWHFSLFFPLIPLLPLSFPLFPHRHNTWLFLKVLLLSTCLFTTLLLFQLHLCDRYTWQSPPTSVSFLTFHPQTCLPVDSVTP